MRSRNRMRIRNSMHVRQRMSLKAHAIIFSTIIIATALIVFLLSMSHSEKTYADTCSSSYTLDWTNPSTFTISCGAVVAAQWTVKNDSCNYYSPVNTVDGHPGDPDRTSAIDVRIGQSGNLTNNDYAWIFIYVNGSIYSSYKCRGDTLTGVFYVSQTITVPAGGNYQVRVAVKNDKTTEFWMIKNGEVTSCVTSPASPLPVTLTSFTGEVTDQGARFKWTTAAEVNNDYFTLSRSSDGIAYSEVARIQGNGTTSTKHDYSFTDDRTPSGLSYYRLSQTDYDGTTKDYGPITVRKKNADNEDIKSSVYPNPFSEKFTYAFSSRQDEEGWLIFYDQTGHLIEERAIDIREGMNNIPYTPKAELKPGIYLVGVKSGDRLLGFTRVVKK